MLLLKRKREIHHNINGSIVPETPITNDLEEIIEFRDIFLTGKHKHLLELGFITLLSLK